MYELLFQYFYEQETVSYDSIAAFKWREGVCLEQFSLSI